MQCATACNIHRATQQCTAAGKPAAPLTHLTEPRIATSRLLNIAIVGFGNFGQFLAARSVQQPPYCAQSVDNARRTAYNSQPAACATHHTTNSVHVAYTSLDIGHFLCTGSVGHA